MTPLDAVATAIRERLLAGRPAPLPGLGTLVRQHVASRIQERADGTRVLMPPGETIGLAASAAQQESLAPAFGRLQGLDDAQAARAYSDAMDQIEARLAATGEVRLPGVGLLRRTSGGVILGVEADLLAAVNRTYEGLTPVAPAARPSAPAADPPGEQRVSPKPPDAPPPEASTPVAQSDGPVETGPHAPQGAAPDDAAPARTARLEPAAVKAFHIAPVPPARSALAAEADRDAVASDRLSGNPADVSAPFPAEAPDALRDLDSEPPSDLDERPEPAKPEGRAVPPDLDRIDPDTLASPPTAAPPADPATLSDVASFVDDDTLDEDLDELAVPFGTEAPLSRLLPPTPEATLPSWSPAVDDIEEAEIVPDEPEPPETVATEPIAPEPVAPEPVAPEPLSVDGESEAIWVDEPSGPIIERVAPPAPDAEMDLLMAEPPDVVLADSGAADPFSDLHVDGPQDLAVAAPEETAPRRSSFPWWLLALAVLLLLALALAYLWPRLMPRAASAAPTETPTRVEAVAQRPAPPQTPADAPAPFPAPQPSEPTVAPPPVATSSRAASGGGVAPAPDDAGRPGLGQPPPPGYAISPPRVVGLAAQDVRALSGREPVDALADAWTLVVLSTASRDDATALRARYGSAGYRAGVVASTSGTRPTYRVAIGQFDTRDDAIRLRDRLPPQSPADTWALDLRTL